MRRCITKVSLGKFLKENRTIATSSQDGACLVVIKELKMDGSLACHQMVEEGIAEGSSSNLYCASDTSHSTRSLR